MSLPDETELLDDLAHAPGGAASLRELVALYGLDRRGRLRLARLLRRLAAAGKLRELRGRQRYGIPRERPAVRALLTGTKKGFAFASPDNPERADILIPERHVNGALHGDRVEVRLLDGTDPSRPAGEVVRIVERGRSHFVGLLRREGRGRRARHTLLPFDPRISSEILVPDRFAQDVEDGEFVEVALLRDSRGLRGSGEALEARVTGVLGKIGEPGTDERVVVASYGLADAHSPEAVAEAERQAASLPEDREISGRSDLRELTTVTIDGDDARDFDDAVSVQRVGERYRLHVHVADVAEHVPEGSRLDAEAYERATSVYLTQRAIHMLPDCLAAGACSLRPNEERLAMTAILEIDREGNVLDASFCESLIRSDRRMTYTEIRRLLVDRDADLRAAHSDLLPDFELMAEVAEALIRQRERRGGLDFDLPVPIVRTDEAGLVTDVVPSERNIAHRIVEEFMIAANEAVARHLHEAGEPCIYRNHEPPAEDRLRVFGQAAGVFGHELRRGGGTVRPAAISAVLASARGRPEEQLLTTLALRTMALARYEVDLTGHFGLALEAYAHFTSPIRRYPDLIVHRALKRLLRGEGTPEEDRAEASAGLAADSLHCSARERNAEEAERALVRWKACEFANARRGEEFDARVTGLADRGLTARLEPHPIDGTLHYRDLEEDYYEPDESRFRIVGRRTGRVLGPGDPIRVRIASVDMLRRHVHLEEA